MHGKPKAQTKQTIVKKAAAADEDLEIVQEHPADAPAGWLELQDKLATSTGLSLLLVDGRQPPAVSASNNNSICRAFQSSPKYVRLCDPYCGDAHRRAMSAGDVVHYKCHAGLECFTAPVQIGGEPNLAVIGGRAFLSGNDYRMLVERFRDGELNELLDRAPFDNVIFAEPQRLTQLSDRLAKTTGNLSARTATPPESKPAVQPGSSALETTPVTAAEDQPELRREVDRLRGELHHRSRVTESLQHFLERITSNTPEQTYLSILTHTKSLLKAERSSLMVFDQDSNELILRAATGLPVATSEVTRARPGQGVAGRVVESGKPMVVANVSTELVPGHLRHDYKTNSFISYPISIHGKKIGVLNVTDKASGEVFNKVDLSLLDLVGPQIAVALERAEWQDRATQFQLMSITDPLTGLLNRRYLEERVTEELNRSTRYGYSMSCLMIDIDDFKKYNDANGHQAGDEALKITAHCLKATLRSADVACRYGGEEFCILLPQTSLTEAGVIAERMRQRVMETDFPYGKSQPLGHVSISIGVSTFAPNVDTAEKIIAAGDRALYNAKNLGKNRIEFFVDNLTAPANK